MVDGIPEEIIRRQVNRLVRLATIKAIAIVGLVIALLILVIRLGDIKAGNDYLRCSDAIKAPYDRDIGLGLAAVAQGDDEALQHLARSLERRAERRGEVERICG